ncbi:MAG: 3-deoxy-D-manno-octulosonate 8-phosphate phosphatase [Bacteroidia bacterium]|nr:3-deoxy-D-manno-octulosonate 8-phosphate phosphatase [Bacteroidia bacterium]
MNIKQIFNNITTFIFDFDGVITDGNVLITAQGDFLRSMNSKDSFALQHAVKQGYNVAIITGGASANVVESMRMLGITDVYLRSYDKLSVYNDYITERGLTHNEVLYMGDDLPDYPVLLKVAAKTCPHNAVHEVRAICNYVSIQLGGHGAVRDVIEQVMRTQSKWVNDDVYHW